MTSNFYQILDFIKLKFKTSYFEILKNFPNIAETIITKNLNKLQVEGKVLKTKVGKNIYP